MADGSVTLEAIAKFDRLETAMARLQRKNESLEKQVARMAAGHSRLESKASGGFLKLAKNAATVAGAYMTIHRAIGLVTEALRAQKQIATDAAKEAITVEDAEAGLILATRRLSPAQFKRLRTGGLEIGATQGIDPAVTLQALKVAFSGTEEENVEERIARSQQVFDVLARVAKKELGEQQNLLSVALNLEKNVFADPTVTKKRSIEEAVNLALDFLSQSPAQEGRVALPKLAQAISAEILASRAQTPEDKRSVAAAASAMQSAVMSQLADPEGAIGRTMIANLGVVMRQGRREGRSFDEVLRDVAREGRTAEDFTFRGKGMTKEFQKAIADNFEPVFRRFTENLAVFSESDLGGINTLSRRMEGETDGIRRAFNARNRLDASRQLRQREMGFASRGLTSEALDDALLQKKGLHGGFQSFMDRRAKGMGEFFLGAKSPQEALGFLSTRLAVEVPGMRRAALGKLGRITGQFGEALPEDMRRQVLNRTMGTLPLPGSLTDDARNRAEQMQLGIMELLEVLKADRAEARLQVQIQDDLARDRESRLTGEWKTLNQETRDIAEGISNSGTAAGRVNAESENR